MMGAAALGVSIFGYTAAVRRWTTASCMLARGHRESPCGEWISNICLRVDPYGMAKYLIVSGNCFPENESTLPFRSLVTYR